MGSPLDSDGQVKTGKDSSQFAGLKTGPEKGGDNGSGNKTVTGLPEGSKGKEFKGK
jgi:hypothetical protein